MWHRNFILVASDSIFLQHTCSINFFKKLKFSCLKVKMKSLSHVRLFVTPWTVAHQAPPSMEFSRQEYWSGFPFFKSENPTNHSMIRYLKVA